MNDLFARMNADFDKAFEKTPKPPTPQPCHHCAHPYAGIACPICKTERPAYTALKNQTARERA